MLLTALLFTAVPDVQLPAASRPPLELKACLGPKTPRKFVEIPQGVQYDGDWSPPAGGQPDPEPDAFTPVKRPAPWLKDIPIIVKPAPLIVTEEAPKKERQAGSEADNEAEINARVEEILRQRAEEEEKAAREAPEGTGDYSPSRSAPPAASGAQGSGSATGSKASVTYSTTPRF